MFEIYNNTNQDLVVILDDEEHGLKTGKVLEFTKSRWNSRIELGCDTFKTNSDPYSLNVTVRTNKHVWPYKFVVPLRYRNIMDEHKGSDFLYCEIKLQINENGLIYILLENEIPPMNNFMNQPRGFPVKPETNQE